jgi:ELWxxDGT repeat protein
MTNQQFTPQFTSYELFEYKEAVTAEDLVNVNGIIYGVIDTANANGGILAKIDPTTDSVTPIVTGAGGNISGISTMIVAGDSLVFRGNATNIVGGLWKIDGAGNLTRLPDPTNMSPIFGAGVHINGKIYFSTSRSGSGTELGQFDLATDQYTFIEINPGTADSNPKSLTNINGTLYFAASNARGEELWKLNTNGTPVLVADVNGTTASSNPKNFIAFNNTIYFEATVSRSTYIFKIDPTTGNAVNMTFGPIVSSVIIGDRLYFSDGFNLGKIDSSGQLSYISSSVTLPTQLTNFGGTLYFKGSGNVVASPTGSELYKLDVNDNPIVIDIISGQDSSNATRLTLVDNKLYFIAKTNASNTEGGLWRIDSPNSNPTLVTTAPFPLNSIDPKLGVVANGGIYSVELSNTYNGLGRIDGTTGQIKKLYQPPTTNRVLSSNPSNFVNVNGTVYFTATNENGEELWRIDPRTGKPVQFDIKPGPGTSAVQIVGKSGDFLFFIAANDGSGNNLNSRQLWKISSSMNQPEIVGSDLFNINFVNVDGGLYNFPSKIETANPRFWKLDSVSGNYTVFDFNLGVTTPAVGSPINVKTFTDNFGGVYFVPVTANSGIWKLDTANNSTSLVFNFNGNTSGIDDSFLARGPLVKVKDVFYTTSDADVTKGIELWKIDSNGASLVADIIPGDDSSEPRALVNINDTLYFFSSTLEVVNGRFSNYIRLWRLDDSGTPQKVSLNRYPDGLVANIIKIQNSYYAVGFIGNGSNAIWKINPDSSTTSLINDNLRVTSTVDVNGTAYFSGLVDTSEQLWRVTTDGTFQQVAIPGYTSSGRPMPQNLTNVDGKLYFNTGDGKLWQIDSATSDVIEVKDNRPNALGTSQILGTANGKLFLAGSNSVIGNELWVLENAGNVPGANTQPSLLNPIAAVTINQGIALNFTVPASTFSDPDANDVLTYSATLKNGNSLPTGITFDPTTRTFQGNPDQDLSLRVVATDRQGDQAFSDFDLKINKPPVIGALFFGDLKEVSTLANKNFGAVLDSTISDPNSDLFILSVSLANGSPLPTWLNFDSANRRFSGTPTTQDIGQLNIRVTATDPGGLSTSKDFALNIKTDRPSVKILRAAGSVFENGDKPTIVLTRDGSLNAPLTVKYSLSGTATAGVDYGNNISYSQTVFNNTSLAVDSTVTFSAGVDQMTITIPTIDDNIYEGKTAETIDFKLENDPAYDLISGTQIQQAIQIVDNENSPVISVSTSGMELDQGSAYKLSVAEGNSGTKRQIEFTAKLNNPSYEAVSVDYRIQNVTTNNDDYTPATGTIAFAPGETEKKVSIEVIGDDRFETDEQFQVVFNNPQGDTTVSDPAGSGKQVLFNINISNDDQRPTVTIAASKNASEAGEIGEFVISRDDVNINEALTVKLETITGADFTTIFSARDTLSKLNAPLGNAGEDYEGSFPTSITFAPGENKITLQVKAIDDRIPEDNQSVVLSIVNDFSYTMGNVNASLRIIDNEIVPAALTKVQKTAAEAGYKIGKLSTTEGVLSIPGNYQILDGNKVLWVEGKDVWFFDGKDKKKLDSDILPNTIELGKNGAAWTKLGAPQNLFFFDGSSTIDLGKVTSGDGSKAFDMAGDRIAYSDGSQIKIYNINTKTTTAIPGEASGIQLDPLGNGVAWYENPNPLAGSYYNQLKFFNGSETVNLARTNDANGARKAVVSDDKVLYTSNLYTNNRTDLYLYDGSKTIKVAEGIENSNANLNGFGIEGDRVYYQVILDDANLPDGTNKPLTALRNYSISTGKTETVFDTTEAILPFVNQVSESSSSGQYTAWNYLQNSATSVNSGIYLEDGINIIGIKDPEPGQGRNEFRPVVAADGSVVFAVYDGAKNRSDLYLVSKNASLPAINQAPTVANPVTDQIAELVKPFTYTIPANAFSDPDAGNTLTYSATLADGSALPTWLTFDANTSTFSGTPPTGTKTGSLALRVTATDNGNLSVSDDFNVTVNNSAPVNQAPVVANAIADTTATIGTAFSFTIPANAFSDSDASNTLTYSATLADGSTLPTWLTFDANTRTFSGTPPTGTGNLNLQVVATDNGGLSVADAFSVAIGSGGSGSGGNTLTGLRKITTSTTGGASDGELVTNFVHAGIAGLSGDGRYVVFASRASNLVADDTNRQTDTFLHDRVNNTNIRLADGNGRAGISRNGRYVAYASRNAAGNPVVAIYDTTNQTTTQVNSTSIPANMGLGIFSPIGISDDGRYISVYTGGGVSLVDQTTDTVKIIPLSPGSRVGLNNPAMSPNGAFIVYTQADFGDSTSTINGIYRYDIAADTATKISSSDYSTAFISGDSRYLHYLERTGAAKKMDLTDNTVTDGNIDLLGNGVYTGNISQISEDGQFRVIIADDSLNTVLNDNNGFKDLFITAAGTTTANQAPVVANAIADQVATPRAAFSLVIPANAFSDPEGNPLTFSATQGDGSTLSTWLTFDAATKTLSGTPPTGSPAVDIKVTATDSGSLSVSDTFRVSLTNSLTGIPGLSTVGNLFRTDSSLNGFAVNPVSQSPSQKVSEIALFAVDDLTGKIGSLNPTDAGYLAAALDRAKPIFSTLASPFFATDKREISLNPNKIYQVIEIVDGSLAQTKQQVAAGQTPSNILFSSSGSNSPIKVIENSDNYRININNNELVLDVTKLAGGAAAIPIGAKSQDLPEGRLIDLTDYAGQTLKISITNASSAYYGNQVGFYEVKDLAGTITVNGLDLRPGDAGYAAAAVQNAILQTDKSGSQSNQNITGGKIYAPVAIANGTFSSFLANNSSNVNNLSINDNNETFAYFNYIGANPDKIDHFRLLNNNTFGVEDVYGGGDRDFNDIKMSLTVTV